MKYPVLFFMLATLFLFGCEKDDKQNAPIPDIMVVDISGTSDWDYCVLGKQDYYFIKTSDNMVPEVVVFHSSQADKDFTIFLTSEGFPSKVMVEGYIFLFENPNGNHIDIGVIFPDGSIEIQRDVETNYDWGNMQLKAADEIEAWSDVIRWTGRVVSGVPCGISVVAAVGSSGIATPLALWTCGNYLLSLSADIAENEFDVHNGFTEVVNIYGNAQTALSCSSADLLECSSGAIAYGFSQWADNQEELEERSDDVQIVESALLHGYGDVQITLAWNNTADLDLHVIDPYGEEIYWNNDYSSSGGILDVDDIDGYGPENIYWGEGQAPYGNYEVYVHHYVWDESGYPVTSNYSVLVNAFGHVKKYTGIITLDEIVHITGFDQNGIAYSVKSAIDIDRSAK